MATETELQSEIKRLQQTLMQQGSQLMQVGQRFEGVGTACYTIITELLMAVGDPEDHDAMKRAKAHAKDFLKNWESIMEQKVKQQAAAASPPTLVPAANGASSSENPPD